MEASIEQLVEVIKQAPYRLTPDTQYGEVANSGSYVIEGQIGDIAEKQTSGTYVIEGVIAYE